MAAAGARAVMLYVVQIGSAETFSLSVKSQPPRTATQVQDFTEPAPSGECCSRRRALAGPIDRFMSAVNSQALAS